MNFLSTLNDNRSKIVHFDLAEQYRSFEHHDGVAGTRLTATRSLLID